MDPTFGPVLAGRGAELAVRCNEIKQIAKSEQLHEFAIGRSGSEFALIQTTHCAKS